ncbi:MAG: DUF3892 domain-containing protein [Thermoplasmata archaeon]
MNDMIEEIDFLISGVKYDDEGIIERVSVHEKMDDYGVGYPYEESREEVIEKMKEGNKYFTLVFDGETKFDYTVGDEVGLVEIEGEQYLRIDDIKDKNDNLGAVTTVSETKLIENI